VNWRRSSVYASRVRPRYPARNPASASRSASVNAGWTGTRAVVVVVIGYLPVGPRPGSWASHGLSNDTSPRSSSRARHVMSPCAIRTEPSAALGNAPDRRLLLTRAEQVSRLRTCRSPSSERVKPTRIPGQEHDVVLPCRHTGMAGAGGLLRGGSARPVSAKLRWRAETSASGGWSGWLSRGRRRRCSERCLYGRGADRRRSRGRAEVLGAGGQERDSAQKVTLRRVACVRSSDAGR